MRIAGKKLRYLLEFFRSLYPRAEVDGSIGRLKRLQDLLGALNDRAVHGRLLGEAAERMATEGLERPSTARAIQRLVEEIQLRAADERSWLAAESAELLPLRLPSL